MPNNRWRTFKKFNFYKAYQMRGIDYREACPCCYYEGKKFVFDLDVFNGIVHEKHKACNNCGYWYEYAFGGTRWGIRNYFAIQYSYHHTDYVYEKLKSQEQRLFKEHRQRLKKERKKIYFKK